MIFSLNYLNSNEGLALQLLTEAFSPFVTMPLEEIDTCFKLNVSDILILNIEIIYIGDNI